MNHLSDDRPNPDVLLETIRSDAKKRKGRLKIFLGYAAGVGKTYSMLDDAHEKLKSGIDVVVGYIEPHTRPETMQLLEGLPVLTPKEIQYRNILLKELDLDAALDRKPELILVDELAHSDAPGMRNKKRYQDIEELLYAGIDVYTTVNIQHIESLNDLVQKITKITVKETIPDYFFDDADTVEIIDFAPEELLKRFEQGKIYRTENAEAAMQNFFTKENLRLLREIAMRKAADRLSHDNLSETRTKEKTVSTKFMVCINSASSTKSIRWTARASEAYHAPWVAVYVEKLHSSNESEIQEKLDLAKLLGAEIVRLSGADIASMITEYAKISGITDLVLGNTRNKKLKSIFETDLVDNLIFQLPNVEVHIIPESYQFRHRKSRRIKVTENLILSWPDSLKTVGILAAATLVNMGLRSIDIGDQNIIMLYILSVLIISLSTAGYLYCLSASVLSVLLFNFFFTVPYYTFNAIQPGYPITFLIMFIVAFITSTLTVRIKTQIRLSVEREHQTRLLYEINKKLLKTRGLENIVKLISEYITKIFDRSVVVYTEDPENSSTGFYMESSTDPYVSLLQKEDERAVAHWVYRNMKPAGAGTDTLMGAGAYYVPVVSQGKLLGVIGVSCVKGKIDQNDNLFLKMLTSQVAMAVERQYLSDEQKKILIESEKEKMRSNLLRAISHDIRNPLTGILGACTTILENGDDIDRRTRDELIMNIKEDSQWLIRMVENLLAVTRIKEGTMSVAKSPEAVEEIVAEAVRQIRKRYPERAISVKVPGDLLMVPMDGTLIVQVLINLIENAIKHSPEKTIVEVMVNSESKYAVFEVRDNGEGIAEADFPYLFESNMPKDASSFHSTRGLGIGLSICKTIIRAHNGTLEAANRHGGGATFGFKLPLDEA